MVILMSRIGAQELFFGFWLMNRYNRTYRNYPLDSFCNISSTVVSHIYTYDRAQIILNFVQPLQKLIHKGNF